MDKFDKFDEDGGKNGAYCIFTKWERDDDWSLANVFLSKEGVDNFMKNVNSEVVGQVELKIYYIDAKTDELKFDRP